MPDKDSSKTGNIDFGIQNKNYLLFINQHIVRRIRGEQYNKGDTNV
jgi:hypothetical protein